MRISRILPFLFLCALQPVAELSAADPPLRPSQVVVLARTEGEKPDPQLQAVIASSVQQELQRAGYQVLDEAELRRLHFPQGLPEFSRTVLLQELSRRTQAGFLLEAVFTSLEEGVRLDCYLSDLRAREVIGRATRSREVDLLFDQMVSEEIAELVPVLAARIAALPPPEEQPERPDALGIGRVRPTPPPAGAGGAAGGGPRGGAGEAGAEGPPEVAGAADSSRAEDRSRAPGGAQAPPAGAAPGAPPAASPPPASPPPASPPAASPPAGTPPARVPPAGRPAEALRLALPPPLPLSLGAGFAPFLVIGEARDYFEVGYLASLYGSWRPGLLGSRLGLGFLVGVNYFQVDGAVSGSDNLLLPFGPDLRLTFGGQSLLGFFAHLSGGPAVVAVGVGGSDPRTKVLPYLLGGAGLQVNLSRRLGLAADVSYAVFFEELFPIMGLAPSISLVFNF